MPTYVDTTTGGSGPQLTGHKDHKESQRPQRFERDEYFLISRFVFIVFSSCLVVLQNSRSYVDSDGEMG